jgi:hypothetical protein
LKEENSPNPKSSTPTVSEPKLQAKRAKSRKNRVIKFDPSQKEDVHKDNKSLMTHLSSYNFTNSPKYGYLYKRSESWLKQWTEKFCVITNVGLLYYNDPSKRPRNLFPLIDTTIRPIKEKSVQINKFVFQIKSFKWDIVFAARTQQDYIEWLEEFKKLQEIGKLTKNFDLF